MLSSEINIGRSLHSLRANVVFLIFNASFAGPASREWHFDLRAGCGKGRRRIGKQEPLQN